MWRLQGKVPGVAAPRPSTSAPLHPKFVIQRVFTSMSADGRDWSPVAPAAGSVCSIDLAIGVLTISRQTIR